MKKNQKTNSVGSCVPHDRNGRVVLVGTYRGDQLTKWRGWYNYPVSGNGEWGTGNGAAQNAKKGRARTPAAPPVGRDAPIAPQTASELVTNCDLKHGMR